jgi:hypothetical protein
MGPGALGLGAFLLRVLCFEGNSTSISQSFELVDEWYSIVDVEDPGSEDDWFF